MTATLEVQRAARDRLRAREAARRTRLNRIVRLIAAAAVEPSVADIQHAYRGLSESAARYALGQLEQAGRIASRQAWRPGLKAPVLVNVYRSAGAVPGPGRDDTPDRDAAEDHTSGFGLGAKDETEIEERTAIERQAKTRVGEPPRTRVGWCGPRGIVRIPERGVAREG